MDEGKLKNASWRPISSIRQEPVLFEGVRLGARLLEYLGRNFEIIFQLCEVCEDFLCEDKDFKDANLSEIINKDFAILPKSDSNPNLGYSKDRGFYFESPEDEQEFNSLPIPAIKNSVIQIKAKIINKFCKILENFIQKNLSINNDKYFEDGYDKVFCDILLKDQYLKEQIKKDQDLSFATEIFALNLKKIGLKEQSESLMSMAFFPSKTPVSRFLDKLNGTSVKTINQIV